MKKKFNLTKLFDNNRFAMIFALVAAIMLYIIVAVTTSDTTNYVIQNVPVNMDLQSAALSNLNLYVVEDGEYFVDITINGPRTVVPRYGPNSPELATTARIMNISGSGEYPLTLVSAYPNVDELPFTIVSYNPASIRVTLDQRLERTFEIQGLPRGVRSASGYRYMGDVINPVEVTVTGPKTAVSRIASAEVSVDLEEDLEETKYYGGLPIVLKDAQGEEIDISGSFLTLSVTEADLNIIVYKETGLPLEVGIKPVPRSFPEESLWEYMTMTADYVEIAGPASAIDPLTEIYLGDIDLRYLSPDDSSYNFPLNLEQYAGDEVVSTDGVTDVWVNFDLSGFDTISLNLTEIVQRNVPVDKEVTIVSSRVDSVTFVGLPDILEELTADDVLVEIDFSDRELNIGQQNYPVKISVPGKGLVWALEPRTVIIQVEEK